ncbi:hypothetical protein BOTBODRAFT_565515 [Botryobasidium botryosum FD-172 SS1]|uniref:Uncharacterized protein n=1 Tax=Botryobasidium botryosum (strain FD-172 SS1) TaxID=930990 RepID=A0A067LYG2_BOTB1|nr:hypothetical protein BOTBODRAFT_565515 [Botryobasidium botryosum FD-172 SS1]
MLSINIASGAFSSIHPSRPTSQHPTLPPAFARSTGDPTSCFKSLLQPTSCFEQFLFRATILLRPTACLTLHLASNDHRASTIVVLQTTILLQTANLLRSTSCFITFCFNHVLLQSSSCLKLLNPHAPTAQCQSITRRTTWFTASSWAEWTSLCALTFDQSIGAAPAFALPPLFPGPSATAPSLLQKPLLHPQSLPVLQSTRSPRRARG